MFRQFKERYEEMYGSGPKPVPKKLKKGGIKTLLRELSDDEDDNDSNTPSPLECPDSDKPWLREFRAYLDAIHELSDGMISIKWWGVCPFFSQCDNTRY